MFDPWLSLPHPPLRGASWLREELEPEALAQGSLAPCPLLTLTMTVASGGVYLLPAVLQVALGAGPRSFSECPGPWEQADTNLYKKRVPSGRREGREV